MDIAKVTCTLRVSALLFAAALALFMAFGKLNAHIVDIHIPDIGGEIILEDTARDRENEAAHERVTVDGSTDPRDIQGAREWENDHLS